MKSVIITFSPSGNTKLVGELLHTSLKQHGIQSQIINIAGNEKYFSTADKKSFLQELIPAHDILFVGSPVYAHHLQYHIKDLISSLPHPDNGWGKISVPFVTYGGINSGIALEEAGVLLRKSGRKVLTGMKVSCSHHMTKAFLKEEYNCDQPQDRLVSVIDELVERILCSNLDSLKDMSKHLIYQSRKTFLKANIIFREKVWHQKRYPKVIINDTECIKCGRCTTVCPVCHLKQNFDKSIMKNQNSPCIHCFNCIFECPQKAVYPIGNLEKAKDFMEKMIKSPKESPATCLYPNVLP